jgi:hypothetical protein
VPERGSDVRTWPDSDLPRCPHSSRFQEKSGPGANPLNNPDLRATRLPLCRRAGCYLYARFDLWPKAKVKRSPRTWAAHLVYVSLAALICTRRGVRPPPAPLASSGWPRARVMAFRHRPQTCYRSSYRYRPTLVGEPHEAAGVHRVARRHRGSDVATRGVRAEA